MNFIKKHLVFSISIAVALLLLAAAVIKMISSVNQFEDEKRGLAGSTTRWQQLHSREPYPSRENVRREQENVKQLFRAYAELSDAVRQGQIDEESMEAVDFMPLLEHTLRRMRARLDEARVVVPENVAFNFEKYAGGQLPVPGDIPRLVQQLRIIEELCLILCEAGISELVSISREVFDAPERAPPTRRRRREPAPAPIPAREPVPDRPSDTQSFKVVFRASERVAFDILNRLAGHPAFIVVTSVNLTAMDKDIMTRTAATPVSVSKLGPGEVSETTPRGQRIITGRRRLEVELELDVYQFAPAEREQM